MSMRTLLSEVRTALTGYSGLTDLIPASKITFALRPQRDKLPGLIYEIGVVDYDETVQSFAAATTYRVDITAYGRSADETTNIHDQIKLALLAASSQNFRIRILDERYVVDVDNNHMCQVQATWQLNSGITNNQTTILSSAFQGYDHMKVKYMYKLKDGFTTIADLNEQVYFLNMLATQSGSSTHSFELPLAEENLGKIYTIVTGSQLSNNYVINLSKSAGSSESVENAQSYSLNRSYASVSLVAMQVTGTSYGWRIWSSHNLA